MLKQNIKDIRISKCENIDLINEQLDYEYLAVFLVSHAVRLMIALYLVTD